MNRSRSRTISLRLTEETRATLERVSKMGPYEVSFTAIIERGIVLAEQEMLRLRELTQERPNG